MNKKNLNCHPEDIEGSQPLHISPRNIAENAKLNHEIAEELKKQSSMSSSGLTRGSRSNKDSLATWILRSSRSMTRMYVLLSIITLLPTLAQAETCTPTPDCKSLGYTETSCPDGGGVKCPWNTSLMYCCKKCAPACELKSCEEGDILYANMKCYTCLANSNPGSTPIGVVFTSKKAVGLVDLSTETTQKEAESLCSNYSIGGISGWHLPSKDELLQMNRYINSVQSGLKNAIGASQLSDVYYRSSTYNMYNGYYWVVNPVSGDPYDRASYTGYPVRPVLAF